MSSIPTAIEGEVTNSSPSGKNWSVKIGWSNGFAYGTPSPALTTSFAVPLYPFAQLFDSLEKEEQVSNLQKFLDALELSLDNEEDTNEEPEESNNDNKETKEPEESKNTADGAGNTGEEDKKDTKDSEEKDPDKKSEAEDEKDTKEETKADDLKDIYDSKNVVIKDTQLNKKVEAILNIL